MEVVTSPEGQNAQDLGTVLARRLMPDTNVSLLTTLHTAGLLHPVPVDNIVMFPLPNQAYPLRKILESMGRLITPSVQQFQNPYEQQQFVDPLANQSPYGNDFGADPNDPRFLTEAASDYSDPYAEAATQAQQENNDYPAAPSPYAQPTVATGDIYAQTDRFNQHIQNQNAGVNERNLGIANNLLIEAQMLESEAKRKREQAYTHAPSLRPAPPAPPRPTAPRRQPVVPAAASSVAPATATAKAKPARAKAATKAPVAKPSRAKAK